MNKKSDKIKGLYFKYLFSAFGSTIVASIYTTVDIMAVGHYSGPNGTASIACINPIWSIFMSTGMLFGIGGSVIMSICRGKGDKKEGDRYFTASFIMAAVAAMAITLINAFFEKELLQLFGANELLLEYALPYMKWIIPVIPTFLLGQYLTAFIRNDNAPILCTAAIISGGVFNIFGDIFFVFTLDMGISGAGLATAMGQVISFAILCSYFFSKKCRLRFAKPISFIKPAIEIIRIGFAPFIVDISFGLSVMLFNNQIMHYGGETELACYSTVSNIAIMFQCLFYAVGQALQPIASTNYGAKKYANVQRVLQLSICTALIMGMLFLAVSEAIPAVLLRCYMTVDTAVMAVGPNILRKYAVSFLLMGINIVAGYYLQSVLRTKASVLISLMRGFILCTAFVFILPVMLGFDAIWWAMALSELITSIYAVSMIFKTSKKLKTY